MLLLNFSSFRNTKSCKLFQAFYGQFVVNFDMEANNLEREALKHLYGKLCICSQKDPCEIMSFVLQFLFTAFKVGYYNQEYSAVYFYPLFLHFVFYTVAPLRCCNFQEDIPCVPRLVWHLFPMYSGVH